MVKQHLINDQINAKEIRLVGEGGEMMGIMQMEDARALAAKKDLDVVLMSDEATPKVCRLMDYSRYLFEARKMKSLARKNVKKIQLKEIQLRPAIDKGDYLNKLNRAKDFLINGDKVKVSIRFKGREIVHKDIGQNLLQRVVDDLKLMAEVEDASKPENKRDLTMIFTPKRGLAKILKQMAEQSPQEQTPEEQIPEEQSPEEQTPKD